MLTLSSVFIASANSQLSRTDWPNGPLFAFVNESEGPCCLTISQSKITEQAHLALTNRYLVNSWPEALKQQRCSGAANVKWVELGRINCCSVRSCQQPEPIKSTYLFFFKSSVFPAIAHWQMHNEKDNSGQQNSTGNQHFVLTITKNEYQGSCKC